MVKKIWYHLYMSIIHELYKTQKDVFLTSYFWVSAYSFVDLPSIISLVAVDNIYICKHTQILDISVYQGKNKLIDILQ